jgi:hypothetical protein
MAITPATILHIFCKDAQGRDKQIDFQVVTADFGATTLPTEAHIVAVITALFGIGKISDAFVVDYSIEHHADLTRSMNEGGAGNVGLSVGAKVISGRGDVGPKLAGWPTTIPGFNEAGFVYDPSNANIINMIDPDFAALRTALAVADIAAGSPRPEDLPYTPLTSTANFLQFGQLTNSRRSPFTQR